MVFSGDNLVEDVTPVASPREFRQKKSQRPPKVPAVGAAKATPTDEGQAHQKAAALPGKPAAEVRRLPSDLDVPPKFGTSKHSSMPEARDVLYKELQQDGSRGDALVSSSMSMDQMEEKEVKISLRSLLKGETTSKSNSEAPGTGMKSEGTARTSGTGLGGMGIFQVANMKMKTKKRVAAARKVLDSLPAWLTADVLNNTTRKIRKASGGRTRAVRWLNTNMQIEQPLWILLLELANTPDKGVSQLERVYELIDKQHAAFFVRYSDAERHWHELQDAGPVGETPLHLCFLLGLKDIGKALQARHYKTPELLSLPYENDLRVWRQTNVIGTDEDDGGLYTGQTVLHIAVAQEDVDLCKWLLDRGASITARATGAFFQPRRHRRVVRKPTRFQRVKAWVQNVDLDQKPIQHFVDVHDSGCYYGEYPLSFAASVGACNVCDLLRVYFLLKRQHMDEALVGLYENAASLMDAEGDTRMKERVDWFYAETRFGRQVHHPAFEREMGSYDYFVNARDSHGNTALHLAVIHKRIETIKWLIENGARDSLGLMNVEGFTPLTLSCRLGLKEVFQALLHHLQTVSWVYGDIKMARLDLEQIDTFRVVGNQLHKTPGWMSAIEIIVAHEVKEFTNDPTFNKLIMEKWTRFGQRIHITHTLVPYLLRLLLTSIYLYYAAFINRLEEDSFSERGIVAFVESGSAGWVDFKWSFDDTLLFPRWFHNALQFFCFFCVAVPTFFNGWHQRRLKDEDMDPNEDGELTTYEIIIFLYKNLLFFLSWGVSFTLTGGIISSIMGDRLSEMELLSISCILHWAMLFIHLITFKSIGVLVIIVFKMFIGDIFKFVVVYFTLVLAFSLAFFALVQMSEDSTAMMGIDISWKGAIVQFVLISLGNRPTTVNFWPLIKQTANPDLVLAVYLVYLVIANLLMLNLLIAMMNKTFVADMNDRHRTFIFPFAHTILRYERMLSPEDRARFRSGKSGAVSEGEVTLDLISKTPYYHVQIDEKSMGPNEWESDLAEQEEVHSIVLSSLSKGSLQTSLDDMRRTIADLRARVINSEWGVKHNVGHVIKEYEDLKSRRVSSILINSIKGDKGNANKKPSTFDMPSSHQAGGRTKAGNEQSPAAKEREVIEKQDQFHFPSFWGNRDLGGEGVAVPAPIPSNPTGNSNVEMAEPETGPGKSPNNKGFSGRKSREVDTPGYSDSSAAETNDPSSASPLPGMPLQGRAVASPAESLETPAGAGAGAGKVDVASDLKLPGAVYSASEDEEEVQQQQQQQLVVVVEDEEEEEESPWERPAASMLGKGAHGSDVDMLQRVSSGREVESGISGSGLFRIRNRGYVPPTVPASHVKMMSSQGKAEPTRRQSSLGREAEAQGSVPSHSPVSNTSDAPHGPDAPLNRRLAQAVEDGH